MNIFSHNEKKFLIFRTFDGDGFYDYKINKNVKIILTNKTKQIPVDSGQIGIIPFGLCKKASGIKYGLVIESEQLINVNINDLSIGNLNSNIIKINTNV